MIRAVGYLSAGALAASAWTVSAEAGNGNPTGGKFAEKHPRRNEVNTRVDNQRERINQGLKNGTLTGQEAKQLRANDRAIKQQEHADVKANGGYLTGAQQKQLNQEENANSQLIHDEKHPQQPFGSTRAAPDAGRFSFAVIGCSAARYIQNSATSSNQS